MRVGLDKREVESLAKTMEVKFTVAGPPIGGAKSGINFNPKDPRKEGVLRRWYAAVSPLLKTYYGTGGDLNVDEIHEVIPITENCGVWHPQEGVFNGHFQPKESQKINRIGQLRQGVLKVIEDRNFSPSTERKFVIADMITGFGVAESIRHYYKIWGGDLTIDDIRKFPLLPKSTEITFSDRYSIAIIKADSYLKIQDKIKTALDFYNDTFLFDQNACTSPQTIYWKGSIEDVRVAQDIFWKNLHLILDEKKYISRDEFVKAMNNYSLNFKPNQVFQIATFFENVGWRSVNSGYMIGKDEEDISKYIFSPEYDDGTYTDF